MHVYRFPVGLPILESMSKIPETYQGHKINFEGRSDYAPVKKMLDEKGTTYYRVFPALEDVTESLTKIITSPDCSWSNPNACRQYQLAIQFPSRTIGVEGTTPEGITTEFVATVFPPETLTIQREDDEVKNFALWVADCKAGGTQCRLP